MTSVAQRLRPEGLDIRTAPAAFFRTHVARLRELTWKRVVRELLALVVIVVCDVYPGWLVGEDRSVQWWVVGLGVAYVAIYLLRLPFPAIALLIGIWMVFTIDRGGVVTTIMLAYAAGCRIASWQRALATAALGMGLGVVTWDASAPGMSGPFGAWVMFTAFGMLVALPFLVGRYTAQRNALIAALQDRERTLVRERQMVSRQVRLRERNRIAQDMHDSLGHRLSLISVHAGALALDTGLGERQREAVQVLRSAALTAMEELRGVIGVLRRDEPEEDQARRTVDAIDELVEGARRAGVRVSLVRGGQPRALPAKVSHAAYRIAQEGLTNASKHAPGASVQVTVKYEPDALVVEVRNNPPRQHKPSDGAGFGLIGLGERVRLAGGMLHVGELPTGGFRIAAVLPYEESPAAGDEPEPVEDEPGEREKPRGVRKWAGVGSMVLAALVVVAVMVGYTWFGVQTVTKVVTPEMYASVQVGDDEGAVRAKLPTGAEPPITKLRDDAPPEPAGSRCEYVVADEQKFSSSSVKVVRFCFKDGKLVEKGTHLEGQ
ncbi:sensor histidine kinase [Saccharothrix obliqua]|uniref:sensor histidine kinase n=1 Tax=Saccharothrix obliqua TaxID=2861747 RepID=UPI0027E2C222|nr:sensor histidine kinase [Saccharothrix obliqua]